MTIFNLYVFDGTGACQLYRSWNQAELSEKAIKHRCKLTFGLIYSLKDFCSKLSPRTPSTATPSSRQALADDFASTGLTLASPFGDSPAGPQRLASPAASSPAAAAASAASPSSSSSAPGSAAVTGSTPLAPGVNCQLQSVATAKYRLTLLESPSGLRVVLTTDPVTSAATASDVLKRIYGIFAELIVKTPAYDLARADEASAAAAVAVAEATAAGPLASPVEPAKGPAASDAVWGPGAGTTAFDERLATFLRTLPCFA